MRDNGIGGDGVRMVGDGLLQNLTLMMLHLGGKWYYVMRWIIIKISCNHIGDGGAASLFSFITHSQSLEFLDISCFIPRYFPLNMINFRQQYHKWWSIIDSPASSPQLLIAWPWYERFAPELSPFPIITPFQAIPLFPTPMSCILMWLLLNSWWINIVWWYFPVCNHQLIPFQSLTWLEQTHVLILMKS